MIILEYFYWQFIEVPKKIVKVFANLIWFGYNFFSVEYCLKTLFNPWRKIAWSYNKGFCLKDHIETFTSNIVSRVMGFLMRVFIVLAWIIYELIIIVLGIALMVFWILLPIIGILGVCISFDLL